MIRKIEWHIFQIPIVVRLASWAAFGWWALGALQEAPHHLSDLDAYISLLAPPLLFVFGLAMLTWGLFRESPQSAFITAAIAGFCGAVEGALSSFVVISSLIAGEPHAFNNWALELGLFGILAAWGWANVAISRRAYRAWNEAPGFEAFAEELMAQDDTMGDEIALPQNDFRKRAALAATALIIGCLGLPMLVPLTIALLVGDF